MGVSGRSQCRLANNACNAGRVPFFFYVVLQYELKEPRPSVTFDQGLTLPSGGRALKRPTIASKTTSSLMVHGLLSNI